MLATTRNIDLLEVLGRLLAGEQGDAFAFLSDAEPYIARGGASLRHLLAHLLTASAHRRGELAALIDDLGGTPPMRTMSAENQYFAFLSADCLLPRLIEAKRQSVARYELAIQQLADSNPRITALLTSHLDTHRRELDLLTKSQLAAK